MLLCTYFPGELYDPNFRAPAVLLKNRRDVLVGELLSGG